MATIRLTPEELNQQGQDIQGLADELISLLAQVDSKINADNRHAVRQKHSVPPILSWQAALTSNCKTDRRTAGELSAGFRFRKRGEHE